MLRILLLVLLFVGLYRFITRIVFPLLRITSAVRGQMRNMQQNAAPTASAPQPSHKSRKGDYIDFEEVK
jgi:hypothetical protein